MLILSRRKREVFRIGPDVKVAILEVDGNQVKVGVFAPKAVPVHREEVYRRIQSPAGKEQG